MRINIKLENHPGVFTNESLLIGAGYNWCSVQLRLKDWIALRFKGLFPSSRVETLKRWLDQPVEYTESIILVPAYITLSKER